MSDTARVIVEGAAGAKPEVLLPAGDPPAELLIHDVFEGDGAAAEPGAHVNTHYVGIGWDTKRQFDSSWDRGRPIDFPLSGVIAGWQQGIPGMKVGGKRKLTIPWKMGYGERGSPPVIPPRADLVFEIELLGVR